MSVQQPAGDHTSPTTYMNNTNTAPQHQHYHHQQQFAQRGAFGAGGGGGKQQEFSGGSGDSSMLPHHQASNECLPAPVDAAAAAAAAGGAYGGLAGLHPMMMAPADSLLSQGSTDLCGLGDAFDAFDAETSHRAAAAAAAPGAGGGPNRQSMEMTDAMGLPPIGAGSPPRMPGQGQGHGNHHHHQQLQQQQQHSPGLSHYGGGDAGGHGSDAGYTADSLQHNGSHHHYGDIMMPQQQQEEEAASALPAPGAKNKQQRSSHGGGGGSRAGSSSAAAAAAAAAGAAGGAGDGQAAPVFRSQYRGVSYDKKKRKWRVQIKVAALGKSGVSVGYFDTEDAAARAYDRAAIGLLGRANCRAILNFPIEEYDNDSVPELVGKTREEVKATLKSERAKMPRRRLTHRRRTSRYLGVGSSNRKNQWQARILYHGKVTHLGYYRTEEEAARVYDKVSISLHGAEAQTNFPIDQYKHEVGALQQKLSGLTREELQRALGVKPMDKSSRFRGVSRKKGRWEAKVMLNRKWAYREMFDTEMEAARAYDAALWRLKPREARNYANFKDTCPPDVSELLATLEKDSPLAMHPVGLPLTAKPLIDAGLLFDDEGVSIKAPNGVTRSVSIGDLLSAGDSAGQTSEDPSAGASNSAGRAPLSGDGASGGAVGAVAGGPDGANSLAVVGPSHAGAAGGFGGGGGGLGGMVKSASYSALTGLDGAVTSSLAASSSYDAAAAAAAPVPLSSLPMGRSGMRGQVTHHQLKPLQGSSTELFAGQEQHYAGGSGRGMTRVQSVPQLRTYGSDAGSPVLPLQDASGAMGHGATGMLSGHQLQQQQQQQWMAGASHMQPQMPAYPPPSGMQAVGGGMVKTENPYWSSELSYHQLPELAGQHHMQQQQPQHHHHGLRASRSCSNLAFMVPGSSSMGLPPQHSAGLHASGGGGGALSPHAFGSSAGGSDYGAPQQPSPDMQPMLVRVGSEQHLLAAKPNPHQGFKGMARIASESQLSSMVPLHGSPRHHFLGPEHGLLDGAGPLVPTDPAGAGYYPVQHQQQQPHMVGGYTYQDGSYAGLPGGMYSAPQHMQPGVHAGQQMYGSMGSGQPGSFYSQQSGMQPLPAAAGPMGNASGSMMMPPLSPNSQQQQHAAATAAAGSAAAGGSSGGGGLRVHRSASTGMQRVHSAAALESINELDVFGQRGHSMPGGAVGAMPPAGSGYLAQHQQQLLPPGGFYSNSSSAGMPSVSTALQPGGMQHSMAAPPAAGGSMYGGGSTAGSGSGVVGSAAAAAAAFGAMAGVQGGGQWGAAGAAGAGGASGGGAANGERSGSPMRAVQIGGEDLDVAMAFLTDHSPRHPGDRDSLDIGGMLTDPSAALQTHSPTGSNSGLPFGGGSGAAAAGGVPADANAALRFSMDI